jgi:crotonobetainyl-CoA:carnitine CoA-transferase CaiB-like acyl-CoA transferase
MLYRPLEGLRVLDLTTHIAGPFCTRLFADYGARVVKVEPPDGGDPTRGLPPFAGDANPLTGGALFAYLNVGKLSVTLDLRDPRDAARARRLVAQSEIVVESFAPGTLESLGLGYETLRTINPRVVLTSISAFGQDGPYRERAASEIVLQAMGGFVHFTGSPEREPLSMSLPIANTIGGVQAYTATLAAEIQARATGHGDWVDVSIMESLLSLQDPLISQHMYSGLRRQRAGRQGVTTGPGAARPLHPKGIMHCKQGFIYAMGVLPHDWREITDMIGRKDLDTPEYQNAAVRLKDADKLDGILSEWLMQRTAAEVYHAAQKRRVPFGVVSSAEDLLCSPHLRERSFFRKIRIGERWVEAPGLPFAPLGTVVADAAPPTLGEHDAAVLSDLDSGPALIVAPPEATDPRPGCQRPPLDGLRVLDLTHVWAGPKCTQILAYLGAEVIKVESPNRPDMTRGTRLPTGLWQYPGEQPGPKPYNRAASFNSTNRRKIDVTLDLRSPRGVELFKQLLHTSDVVTENFSVGVVERLGLGYSALSALKPDIVMVSMPGFGSTGVERDYVSFAGTISSTSGVLQSVGYFGEPPIDEGLATPDPFAGNMAAAAVLTALRERAVTGRGRHVEVSQREALIGLNSLPIIEWQLTRTEQVRYGNRDRYVSPQGIYPATGDDEWVALTIRSTEEWAALCELVGRQDWLADARLRTAADRQAAADEIDAAIGAWTAKRSAAESASALQERGIPAGVTVDDLRIAADPHLAARGFFEVPTHPEAGTFRHPVPLSAHFRRRSMAPVRPAPIFGEHNRFVLSERLGLSEDEIDELGRAGVIAFDPIY